MGSGRRGKMRAVIPARDLVYRGAAAGNGSGGGGGGGAKNFTSRGKGRRGGGARPGKAVKINFRGQSGESGR